VKKLVLLTALLCALAWTADNTTAKSVSRPATPQTDAITIPRMLSYQGKLLDNFGNPVLDTTYSVLFSLYTVPSGGGAFWSETQTVRTRTGLFSVLLGSVTPIGALPEAGALYLGMKVGADPEMTPRVQVTSAAYAYIARKADTANYALAGGSADNAWVRGTPDSVLYTIRQLGIARGGAGNMLHGTNRFTHVNLGVACTTGVSGQDRTGNTVGGGLRNVASGQYASVPGGYAASATHYGEVASASGCFDAAGDAQVSQYVLRGQGAGDVVLTLDGLTPGAGNGLKHTQNRTVSYDILVVVNGAAAAAGFHIWCVVQDAGGTTTMVGSPTVTCIGDNSGGIFSVWAWVGSNALWVTGNCVQTARWVATVRTAEQNW